MLGSLADTTTHPRNLKRRGYVALTMNTLLGAVFIAAVAMSTNQVAWNVQPTDSVPSAPKVEWSQQLEARFPGCHKSLPADVIPAAVIEVREGFPVRVDFDDAWDRTHDDDAHNNGDVIGACR